MSSNVKKVVAGVTALAMISTMVACGSVNKKGSSSQNIEVCVKYSNDIEHPVKKGDTLYRISEKYYNSSEYWQELAFYNKIGNPRDLKAGSTLSVPKTAKKLIRACGGDIHPIEKGDTLSEICRVYYGSESQETVWKLATYNNLSDPSKIIAGNSLRIPSKEVLERVRANNYANLGEQVLGLKKR